MCTFSYVEAHARCYDTIHDGARNQRHGSTLEDHPVLWRTHTYPHAHAHTQTLPHATITANSSERLFFFCFSGASVLLCWKAHKGGIYTHEWTVLGDMYATNEEEMMADGRFHRMEREDAWMGIAVRGSVDRRKGKIGGKIPSANMEARA